MELLIKTSLITDEMMERFHAETRVGNLMPVTAGEYTVIPAIDWDAPTLPEMGEEEGETEYLARVTPLGDMQMVTIGQLLLINRQWAED